MIQTTTDNNVFIDYNVTDDNGVPATGIQEVQAVVRDVNDPQGTETVINADNIGGVYVASTGDFPGPGMWTIIFRAKVSGDFIDSQDQIVRIYQGVYAT